MVDSAPTGRQSTTRREWIPYAIELPIVVSTESRVRIKSAAAIPRLGAFNDEKMSLDQLNVSHKV
jgi:hypothetical protein